MSIVITPTLTGHLAVCAACRAQVHVNARIIAEHFRRHHVCDIRALRARRVAERAATRPGGDVA